MTKKLERPTNWKYSAFFFFSLRKILYTSRLIFFIDKETTPPQKKENLKTNIFQFEEQLYLTYSFYLK